ncbi:MAG: ABC transporter permease [Sulfolobales archaeon]
MSLAKLVKKEVMAVLKSPAFIMGLVFMAIYFVALGRMVGVTTEQVVREAVEAPVGVIVEDEDYFTARVVYTVNASLKGRLIAVRTIEEGVRKFSVVISIPRGFGASLLGPNATAFVNGYVAIDRASVFQQARAGVVTAVARALGETAKLLVAIERGVNISELNKVVVARVETRVGGRVVNLEALSSLFGSTMMFAVFIGILAMMTLMYSAQAVASEKEEKAFEMLLTLPVSRSTIALAKIAGAVVISVFMVVIYFAGFSYMMSAMPQVDQTTGATTFTWSLWDLVTYLGSSGVFLLVVSLGLMLLFSGALGLLIGVLSSDTRVAGALAGPIGAVLYVGLIATQFIGVPLGIEASLLGATVYGLPLAIVVASVSGDETIALLALLLSIAVVATILTTVVKVFGSERILIGVSIRRRPK